MMAALAASVAMTEIEWLVSERLDLMLNYLIRLRGSRPATRRQLRLFGAACCRLCWHLIAAIPEARACVEFAEGSADGSGSEGLRAKVMADCYRWSTRQQFQMENVPSVHLFTRIALDLCRDDPTSYIWFRSELWHAVRQDDIFSDTAQVSLLRCVFGNPFRPVAFDPSWRTETAVALAAGIYKDRAFDRLPILADALEEAGCDHVDVLTHCREPNGVHARGCWVVDGVLGK